MSLRHLEGQGRDWEKAGGIPVYQVWKDGVTVRHHSRFGKPEQGLGAPSAESTLDPVGEKGEKPRSKLARGDRSEGRGLQRATGGKVHPQS